MNIKTDSLAPVAAVTRRRALGSIGIALGGMAVTAGAAVFGQEPAMKGQPAGRAGGKTAGGPADRRTSIHYDLEFKASPQRMYEAILDEKQFAAFSGLPAKIDPAVGGAFSMFGGLIVGRNVELIKNLRIVQAWRPTHWDPGVYSVVHFEFKGLAAKAGSDAGAAGTAMAFDHTGFPEGEYDHLDWGWGNHYWEPLRKYFA
jgi:activator of HSP90 ATPase